MTLFITDISFMTRRCYTGTRKRIPLDEDAQGGFILARELVCVWKDASASVFIWVCAYRDLHITIDGYYFSF
jgi:hypothetical protein